MTDRLVTGSLYSAMRTIVLSTLNQLLWPLLVLPLPPRKRLRGAGCLRPLRGHIRCTIASIFLCTAWSATQNKARQDLLDKIHITKADCKLSFPGTQVYTFEATEDNANQMMTYINANEVELCLDEKPQFHIIASTLTGGAPFASLVEELAITHAKMGLPHVHVLQSLGGAGNTQKLTEPSQVTGKFLHAMVVAMVVKPSQLQRRNMIDVATQCDLMPASPLRPLKRLKISVYDNSVEPHAEFVYPVAKTNERPAIVFSVIG